MTATVPFIQKTFDTFNALCFEGVLPSIPITLTKARSFLGKIEYKGRRGLFKTSNRDFRMKISTSFDLAQDELEDVVLHEMIHYYIGWRNIRDNSVHGKVFRKMMNQFNDRYGRHITIRHKAREGQCPVKESKPHMHHVCITSFTDGYRGVTVAASTKVYELDRFFSRCPDIKDIRWYESYDPFFDRFPRSRTPKVYRITSDEIKGHLKDAKTSIT